MESLGMDKCVSHGLYPRSTRGSCTGTARVQANAREGRDQKSTESDGSGVRLVPHGFQGHLLNPYVVHLGGMTDTYGALRVP